MKKRLRMGVTLREFAAEVLSNPSVC